jgi:hypothetical protein
MRTVLYGIDLLMDKVIMNNKVYIRNQMEWGESRMVERQERERGREAERC